MKPEPTIFVVDDDEAVRLGLQALLTVRGYPVELFASAGAFLASVGPERSGCLLVDVRMPGMSGLELQRELKRRGMTLPLIVITGHGDVAMAVTALKAGAADFLEKPFDPDALLAGIEQAVGRQAAAPAADPELAARLEQLTPREREVMHLVVAGASNKEVAHRLQIALRTVEIHRARVMEKMGARNLSELIRTAIRLEPSAGG